MQLSEHAQWIVNQMLEQVLELDQRVAAAEQRLRQATAADVTVDRLMDQEGVGEVTAWVLRAFVGRFDRFASGKQLSRYCGLSPKNLSSGAKQGDGGLIKASNKILRATAIQGPSLRMSRTTPMGRPRWWPSSNRREI
ncbi:MAG TPA: transposase [Tepidisphaeraceae bacterium]|nr:transposase [Tepidisphaeraceae bacterium]